MRTLSILPLLTACSINTAQQEQHFTIDEPFTRIEISSDAGAIDIIGGDAEQGAIVDSESTYSRSAPQITARVSGATLMVDVDCPVQSRCSADLVLHVPSDVEVAIDSDAGPLTISDIRGNIDAYTDSGPIDVYDVDASTVFAESGSGPVTIELLTAPSRVDVQTGSGPVDVTVPSQAYQLDLATGSGPIDVHGIVNDATSTGRIRVSTGSGPIVVSGR